MLSTSFAFREAVREGRHLETRADVEFADGTSTTLYGEDMAMGGMSCSGATSSTTGFDIGAAIVGSATLTLANFGGEWDDADFTGAEAVLYVGVDLGEGEYEWLRKGTYGVEQPESYDASIELALHDNMRLFQVPYSGVSTTFPATLQTIVGDVCLACGVTMLSASFPNCSQVVAARPDDARATCLDVLSWAAQMAGCFCDMDPWGRLRVRWYATSAFEVEDWLDGGTFSTDTTPYSDGDVADGGHFHYGGDDANGGSFSTVPWAVVSAIRSLTTATDDVVITGVRVTASDQVHADGTPGADGEAYLYGTEGYVLSVEGNPLVLYGQAQSVAETIGPNIVGMRFRPLSVSAHGDPAIEPGDPLLVVDRKQRTYRSWVTRTTWKAGGFQSTSCDAETPARNRAEGYSAATRAIVEQRNAIKAERTARELAVSNLARELSEAGGLYKTEEQQPDHSVIYYLHDKPTLADSQIIWNMTSAAFAVSVDGGTTYPFGFDAWGNAILNAIYAIGIDATYVTTGLLRSQNGAFSLDLSTGVATIGASSSLDGHAVSSVVGEVDDLATMVRQYGGGVLVCRQGNTVGALVDASGSFRVVTITWSNAGVPTAGRTLWQGSSNGTYIYDANSKIIGKFTASGVVIGSADDLHVVIGAGGLELYAHPATQDVLLAHLGFGNVVDQSGGYQVSSYYDLGCRESGSTVGWHSTVLGGSDSSGSGNTASGACAVASGMASTASGVCSSAFGTGAKATGGSSFATGNSSTASGGSAFAEGAGTTASGGSSHAEGQGTNASGDYGSHAEGYHTKATGAYSHAEGYESEARGNGSHAEGLGTIATGDGQLAIGRYNATSSSYQFLVGDGSSDSNRSTKFYVTYGVCHASLFDTSSDRRIKEHHAYLGDDAMEFVRKLKPALFTKDGRRSVGFYAQDVEEADPWDTAMVTRSETGELDGPVLGLDYQALIAPLVAYAQGLERRIGDLERRLAVIEERG